MTDTVLARIAALKAQPITNLKQQWRELFESEPPPYNRSFLEHRLAYRIQELAYGGLKPETIKRLKAIAEDLDGGDPARRRRLANDRPIAGTRLIREYQGVEHCVTVRDEDFEYQGRPYKSLSAVARAITGTRWNGWTFFGFSPFQIRSATGQHRRHGGVSGGGKGRGQGALVAGDDASAGWSVRRCSDCLPTSRRNASMWSWSTRSTG
jgi:hypothetical protein